MESRIKNIEQTLVELPRVQAHHTTSMWNANKFLAVTTGLSAGALTVIAALNISADIFGLFRSTHERSLPVYHNERTAKYLLSYRYIPENFNTAIFGASLSDNLDVASFNATSSRYQIYNASVMGANMTEISAIARKATAGGVKNVIFCANPYQFKDHGFKETELNQKVYYSALGSKDLFETYAVALIRMSGLAPGKFPQRHINEYGTNFFTERYRVKDVKKQIFDVADALKDKKVQVNEEAMSEFKSLMAFWKAHHVNVIIYFHPVPTVLFESRKEDYVNFKKRIIEISGSEVQVLDFNTSEYTDFTNDYDNYIDNGHLSEKGADFVTRKVTSLLPDK